MKTEIDITEFIEKLDNFDDMARKEYGIEIYALTKIYEDLRMFKEQIKYRYGVDKLIFDDDEWSLPITIKGNSASITYIYNNKTEKYSMNCCSGKIRHYMNRKLIEEK